MVPLKKKWMWKIFIDFFFYLAADCNAVLKALQPVFQEQGMTETVHNWEDHGYLATYIQKNGRWVDFTLHKLPIYPPYKYFSPYIISCCRVLAGQTVFNIFVYEVTKIKRSTAEKQDDIGKRYCCQSSWIGPTPYASRGTLSKLPSAMPRWLLSISKEGTSTT